MESLKSLKGETLKSLIEGTFERGNHRKVLAEELENLTGPL